MITFNLKGLAVQQANQLVTSCGGHLMVRAPELHCDAAQIRIPCAWQSLWCQVSERRALLKFLFTLIESYQQAATLF